MKKIYLYQSGPLTSDVFSISGFEEHGKPFSHSGTYGLAHPEHVAQQRCSDSMNPK